MSQPKIRKGLRKNKHKESCAGRRKHTTKKKTTIQVEVQRRKLKHTALIASGLGKQRNIDENQPQKRDA